ncbi:MAG: 6-bladed beta-propeller [Bacteroidia bacterium]|nr:MAG: 6-bladed beta-propeller [Bacteroidia bacterium]
MKISTTKTALKVIMFNSLKAHLSNNFFSKYFNEAICQSCHKSITMLNSEKNILIVFLTFFLFLTGCGPDKPDDGESTAFVIDYHTTQIIHFEDYFDFENVTYVFLGDDNSVFLSDNLQIEFTGKYFFVLDKGYAQLYRFDNHGSLINKIGRSGRGPAEYYNPGFFALDAKSEAIDILSDNGSTIMTFNFEGDFLKEFSTPLIVTSFDRLNSNLYFYYTGYHNSPNFHRLHRADTTQILESYLPLKTQAIDMVEMNFSPKAEYGYFRETFFSSVYKYDKDGVVELLTLDFGIFEITKEDLEKVIDPFDFFQKIDNEGFCTTVSLRAGNDIFCVVTLKQGSGDARISHFYVNIADSTYNRVVSNAKQDATNAFFSQLRPVHIDLEGRVWFLTNPFDLQSFLETRTDYYLGYTIPEEYLNPLLIILPFKDNS